MDGAADQTSTRPVRVCPHCGADRWKMRDSNRIYEESQRKGRDAEKLARENGLLRYRLETAEAKAREAQSRLQRKIVKQARVIRRFEERWAKLGKPPYEGEGFNTSTGSEYDAGERLPGEAA
jgi:hypothetical protein